MKIWKWLLIITVLVNIGLAAFQVKQREGKADREGKEEHRDEAGTIELSKESQQLIDLKTFEAKLSNFTEKVAVTGQIAQDAELAAYVTASQAGTLTQCKTELGRVVNKGDTLCLIRTNGTADSVIEIKAPAGGVIISDFVKTGDKVDSISSLHTIADLSNLLATFDVYEKDIAKVKTGQRIALRSVAYPDKAFEGEIIFISPRVDENTHTVKVRVKVVNPGYMLKLGMFVTGDIVIESEDNYVIVPQEAVHIVGGKRIVFLKTGEQDFAVREVTIKRESKEEAAIEGVNEGEIVVVQDGFLLKSELLKSKMGEGCAE